MPDFCYKDSLAASEEIHEVRFFAEDGTLLETMTVKDGECITSMPELDQESFEWRYNLTGKEYDVHYPVFEDMGLYAKRKFKSQEEYADYKLEKVKNENSLDNYLTLLQDTDLSVCIYLPADSGIMDQAEKLQLIEALCAYQMPACLQTASEKGQDFFLLIDNGWETIWESVDGEMLEDIGTTFGMVRYQSSEDGRRHLYIQDTDTDYLEMLSEEAEVQFIVIDRLTGCIEDVAAFTMSERIE